ncbi:TM2 domain-containing protein [Hydrogenophaga sp.]|uniref:TM2 domain-containing protein n=1 Tax=Hydrogenophaga sp. TaxID=1904254 RepID=UPI0019BBCA1D|nr:TM2 domain-containing protein [Hydrogenophaga sp.]MBD3892484.1 TM2 domain-containing protein [Hydrogenophaga sp.]
MTNRLRVKNKTLVVWLALLVGSFGLHRFYLRGLGDWIGWLHPIPTALGWWGVERALTHGQDDPLSWLLIPLLGLTLSASCLAAVVYALTEREPWNRKFNPEAPADSSAGATRWLTVGALLAALMLGSIAFMGSLAFGVQRYFEYQIEQERSF